MSHLGREFPGNESFDAAEVPEDVERAAHDCLVGVKFFPPSDKGPTVIAVARAILAERGRCSAIVDSVIGGAQYAHYDYISAAIRDGTQP